MLDHDVAMITQIEKQKMQSTPDRQTEETRSLNVFNFTKLTTTMVMMGNKWQIKCIYVGR